MQTRYRQTARPILWCAACFCVKGNNSMECKYNKCCGCNQSCGGCCRQCCCCCPPEPDGDIAFSFYKIGTNGETLPGAEFYLIPKCSEQAGTALHSDMGTNGERSAISGSQGLVDFGMIPYGCYDLIETTAPEGYLLSNNIYTVQADRCGVTIDGKAQQELVIQNTEKCTTPPCMRSYNPAIACVESWFSNMGECGKLGISHFTDPSFEDGISHFTGMGYYGGINIFSKSSSVPNAYYAVAPAYNNNDGSKSWFIGSPLVHNGKVFNQFNGFQIIGDYLVMAAETFDHSHSLIAAYDISGNGEPRFSNMLVDRGTQGAKAVAISQFWIGNQMRYLLAVQTAAHKMDFYVAEGSTIELLKFQLVSTIQDSGIIGDYSGMGLVLDSAKSTASKPVLYLLAPYSKYRDVCYKDYCDLARIDIEYNDGDYYLYCERAGCRQLAGTNGIGVDREGVHFGNGSGIQIVGNKNTIRLFATERITHNYSDTAPIGVNNGLAYNIFE